MDWPQAHREAPTDQVRELFAVIDNAGLPPPSTVGVSESAVSVAWHHGDVHLFADLDGSPIIEWALDAPGQLFRRWATTINTAVDHFPRAEVDL